MASDGNRRSGLLTAGGILSTMVGALEVAGGGTMVALAIAHRELFRLAPPGTYAGIRLNGQNLDLIWLIILGVCLVALGVAAIAGGVSAIGRKIFVLSLAGAVCALPSVVFGLYLAGAAWALVSLVLGILAVIFVALSRRQFEA